MIFFCYSLQLFQLNFLFGFERYLYYPQIHIIFWSFLFHYWMMVTSNENWLKLKHFIVSLSHFILPSICMLFFLLPQIWACVYFFIYIFFMSLDISIVTVVAAVGSDAQHAVAYFPVVVLLLFTILCILSISFFLILFLFVLKFIYRCFYSCLALLYSMFVPSFRYIEIKFRNNQITVMLFHCAHDCTWKWEHKAYLYTLCDCKYYNHTHNIQSCTRAFVHTYARTHAHIRKLAHSFVCSSKISV